MAYGCECGWRGFGWNAKTLDGDCPSCKIAPIEELVGHRCVACNFPGQYFDDETLCRECGYPLTVN